MIRNPEDGGDLRPLSSLDLVNCSLRLFLIPLSIATVWITVTNHQDITNYGKVDFINQTGLKYMIFVSGISAGYALVASFSSWTKFLVTKTWFFFVSDQVIAYLMVTSMAAVMQIIYLAYHGDQRATWSEACSSYRKFCNKMEMAVALQAMSLVLAAISVYRVFSLFEPPFVHSKDQVEDEQRI